MRWTRLIVASSFIGLGAVMVIEGLNLTYYSQLGPGPGFFPFWLGAIMAGLSIVWFVQTSVGAVANTDESVFPNRVGALRIVMVIAALLVFAWLLDLVGFQLTMLAFLLFILAVLGRQSPVVTATISLAGSIGVYYLFRTWLNVPLPTSSIDFLKNLGL